MLLIKSRKPTMLVLTGVLAAAGLLSAPVATAQDLTRTALLYGTEQQSITPVPAAVTKGIQQLALLLPELSALQVELRGPVDGPGTSGIAIAFLTKAGQAEEEVAGEAIFAGDSGNLLNLWLKPTAEKPAKPFSEEEARAKAESFAAGLLSAKNRYYALETHRDEAGMTDVRLVRKINQVVLDDAYDVFVTFDPNGRLVGFRTFNGKMYEPVNLAELPPAQRVISVEQAEAVFAKSKPLEKVYLLPQQAESGQPVEARLVYVIRDGVVKHTHTGGAVDAVTGKRLLNQAVEQPSVAKASQTVTLQGAGRNWSAQTAEQAAEVVRKLFRAEPGKLPVSSFTEEWSDGRKIRAFIWGHFREEVADADKQYELGSFPEGIAAEQKKHLMLVTDAGTGEVIRFLQFDQTGENGASVISDEQRAMQVVKETLEQLLPAGEIRLVLRDFGTAENRVVKADPVINGIPVYREGQTSEEAMYTVAVDSRNGKIQEVQRNVPAQPVYPQATNAISEEEAVKRLLLKFPFMLTYIHQIDAETGKIKWNLAYDLSYRQSRAACFCGPEPLVDETISVDAFSGEVAVKEQ
mgnify:FL=1